MSELGIRELTAFAHEVRTRLGTLEKIALEIGDELRARCDYRWFSLGDLLDELKNNRKALADIVTDVHPQTDHSPPGDSP
jgi:hypothetical protein